MNPQSYNIRKEDHNVKREKTDVEELEKKQGTKRGHATGKDG